MLLTQKLFDSTQIHEGIALRIYIAFEFMHSSPLDEVKFNYGFKPSADIMPHIISVVKKHIRKNVTQSLNYPNNPTLKFKITDNLLSDLISKNNFSPSTSKEITNSYVTITKKANGLYKINIA